MKQKINVILRFVAAKVIIITGAFLIYYILHSITWPKEVSSPLAALLTILLWAYLSSLILFAFVRSPKKDTKATYIKGS